ncbi:MAG: EAL domain-containing protein [Pseudomonadota bacterium]
MIHETVTHLLIAAGGNGATQRIIDELQKEGMPVSAATADTKQELANLIQQPQWEAIICFEDSRISVPVVSDLASQSLHAIPVILVTSAEKVIDLLPMLDQGIADVVPEEQAKRLFLSVQRESINSRLKRDLRQREKSQAELESRHCTILSSSAYPISYVHDGAHLYSNQSYASLFGFETTEAINTLPFLNLIQEQDHSLVKALFTQPPDKEESVAIRVIRRDGSEGDMMLSFAPVEFQSKPCMQLTGRPLMGAIKEKPKPSHAVNDLAANLPNDAQFAEQIEASIQTALNKEINGSLLVIALNDRIPLQSIEDKSRLNSVIADISRFTKDFIQKSFTLARLSEHIFGLIITGADTDEVASVSALIKSSINKHFDNASPAPGELISTIGSTLINGRELKIEYVVSQASRNLKSTQLEKIKQSMIKNKPESVSNADMLEYLMIALTQKRFKLLYQPVVHIKGVNHKGYEVLTRMLNSEGTEILPEAFIRVANQNGIGEKLDKLIISMAIDALDKSKQAVPLIINVSNNALTSRTFLPWLIKQLEKKAIAADLFTFAISESDIHNNESHAIDFCHGLNAAGLKFEISHFGCSLDPYAVLAEIKPHLVKLDSSLLKDISKRSMQRTTVQTLVTNLHNREILVIAPQVESLATLPILWDTGIDYVQGYCLQAPSHEMNYNFLVEEEITLSAGRI